MRFYTTALYICGALTVFAMMPYFLDNFPVMKEYAEGANALTIFMSPFLILGYFIFYTWKEHRRNGISQPAKSVKKKLKLVNQAKKPVIDKAFKINAHERTFSKREPGHFKKIRKRILIFGLPLFFILAVSVPYVFKMTTDLNYVVGCAGVLAFFIIGTCLVRPVSNQN